jgi:predicted ferric reductase
MDKNKLNFVVDFLALISFLVVAKTGLIILFFLPDGVRQGRYQEFFGITKSTYSDIHNWAGVILIILVIIHVILHWQWIVCSIKNLFKKEIK